MDERRFEAARAKSLVLEDRVRHGIGMQKEKTLHAVLKDYFDPDEDHQEIPITGAYIADIWNGSEIIEIQNGNFCKIRGKLTAFLKTYRVRLVYPLPAEKYVTWVDPETGQLGKRSKSPKHGSFYDAFRELYRIRPFLKDPNLTVHLLLVDMEEYRLQDGWSRDRKHGSHRFDRIPTRLSGELILDSPRDYLAFVPIDLKEPFTAKEFAAKAGVRAGSFSAVPLILTDLGVIERVGKKGNSYLYRCSM
ncbi:MAG: hypothetical protein LKJ76_09770 [Lachnospiraceae bacterium]|jgi:hypothetical protein|nr:hypothetical protein [Lachnospiraceae bacterium]